MSAPYMYIVLKRIYRISTASKIQSKNNIIDEMGCFSDQLQPMICAAQCRAARGLLNWTQQDLAGAAEVGVVTVRQFELAGAVPRRSTLLAIKTAFEAAGVEFIDENGSGPGVRLKKKHTSD